ncbi:hypothetical protein A4E84_14370 [Streptomyces qaidamensis]|uniref:Uncharacterized protein n=1 Tax=Streptomyces qaidamensis TaxID=1783515 RepID=A0A143BZM0_9ACTN|nr:hypothetical protein A4E84_14370 [Streptomyces qaidamensis]
MHVDLTAVTEAPVPAGPAGDRDRRPALGSLHGARLVGLGERVQLGERPPIGTCGRDAFLNHWRTSSPYFRHISAASITDRSS